jgi:hypothetical protein
LFEEKRLEKAIILLVGQEKRKIVKLLALSC